MTCAGSFDGHALSDATLCRDEVVEALTHTVSCAAEFLTKLYNVKPGDPGPEWGVALGSQQCSVLRLDKRTGTAEENRGMEMTDSLYSIESSPVDPGHSSRSRAVSSTSTPKKSPSDLLDSGSHPSRTNSVPYSSTGHRGMDWAVMLSDGSGGPASSNSTAGCDHEMEADETVTLALDSLSLDRALDLGPRERSKQSQSHSQPGDRGSLGQGEVWSKVQSTGNRSLSRKEVQSEKTRAAAGGTMEKRRSLPIFKEGKPITPQKLDGNHL
jgi:hypothetical protein